MIIVRKKTKVTSITPIRIPYEASNVLLLAQDNGIEKNKYQYGKYKLGSDWLLNLPKIRTWFNHCLEITLSPYSTTSSPKYYTPPLYLVRTPLASLSAMH